MNIVVLVKQVPDTWAERKLRDDDKTLDRDSVDAVINELDEYGIEEALRIKEAGGAETVTVLSMGPERATETIRKGLQMGADTGVHVVDDALRGSDVLATSAVLAAALGTVQWDLVICSSESTDARMGVMAALLAERLGVAQLSGARKVTVEGGAVTIERQTEDGYDVVKGNLPAVVSVVEKINEPRYPSFKGIMAAKKKPVTTLSLADIDGVESAAVGLPGAATEVVSFAPRPPRQAGQVVKDEGEGGVRIAEFLAGQKLI